MTMTYDEKIRFADLDSTVQDLKGYREWKRKNGVKRSRFLSSAIEWNIPVSLYNGRLSRLLKAHSTGIIRLSDVESRPYIFSHASVCRKEYDILIVCFAYCNEKQIEDTKKWAEENSINCYVNGTNYYCTNDPCAKMLIYAAPWTPVWVEGTGWMIEGRVVKK